MRKLPKIISGGQTGVDQAALTAARQAGLATGGWVPKGWLTEDGPAAWLAEFGLSEMPTDDYPPRTRRNVTISDATLWLGDPSSTGGRATCEAARRSGKPLYVAESLADTRPAAVADWLQTLGEVNVLNVAGNRESVAPGIGAESARFLVELFALLRSRHAVEKKSAE
jgi:hypothetical protein